MLHVSHLRDPEVVSVSHDAFSDAFLTFVKWSQGIIGLEPALRSVAIAFGADAVCLSRREIGPHQSKVVKIFDSCQDHSKPKLDCAFAPLAFVGIDTHLKTGASVLMSETHSKLSRNEELSVWMMRRKISDVGVICLGSSKGTKDFLEFHFVDNSRWAGRASVFGAMLAEVYLGRRVGLIEQQMMPCETNDGSLEELIILADDNPAKLTKCEWRLCVLISSGLSREGIANELGISKNTVRTHLRNIYGKTGRGSFNALAHRLVQPCEQQHLSSFVKVNAA